MIIEERIVINSTNKIGATIARPDDQKRPLVLLIMGTGKADRDGNMKGFKTDFYKTLSDMFVKMGYVCIRYDKRGTYESTGNFKTAGLNDLVLDSAKVINFARQLDYVDENRIIACGHSEGAMIATLLTKQEQLDSIILLGGACLCLKSAMQYQNMNVIEELKGKKGFTSWIINKTVTPEKIEKQLTDFYTKAKESKKDSFFYRGAFMPTKWVKEHGELTNEDFVNMIQEYNGKVLAITGKSDLQADYTALEKIAELDHVTTYAPENVNHMLREVDDNNSYLTVQKQYVRLASTPIHKGTEDQIEQFLDME